MNTATQMSNDLNNQVCARVLGRDVTRAELTAQFDRVQNAQNWKAPIDALVVLKDNYEQLVLAESVVFFAGCVPTITLHAYISAREGAVYRVKAAGYYAAVGA